MNWTPELLYLIHCFGVIGLACFTIAGLCGAVLSVRDVPRMHRDMVEPDIDD